MKEEVTEVEAEVIEEEIAPISGLDILIAEIEDRAGKLSAEYLPHDIADEADYGQSKRERTAARKDIASLKARYTDVIGDLKDAIKDADARMKMALAPLDYIDKGYASKIRSYEQAWETDRILALNEEYEGAAPDLMPLVPLDRIIEVYGKGRTGKKWLLRGTKYPEVVDGLMTALQDIANAEAAIDAAVEESYREHAKARFFETLDIQRTLTEEAEAKAQRDRVRQLEAERQERVAEPIEEPEPATEVPESVPEAPEAAPAPPAPPMPAPPVDVPPAPPASSLPQGRPWVVIIPSATKEQMMAMATYLKGAGLTGQIKCGTLQSVYARR